MSSTLTPADVQCLFIYEDGALLWRDNHGRRGRAGAIAGSRSKNGQHAIRIDGVRYMRSRLVWAWHHGAWPAHKVCHADHDSSNDAIDNLLDLDHAARRQLQRNMQRALPAGVAHARHGHNFTARLNGLHLGSYKSPDEAHAAYAAAHIAEHCSASPYAVGGLQMSETLAATASPPESYFFANGISAANISEALTHGTR